LRGGVGGEFAEQQQQQWKLAQYVLYGMMGKTNWKAADTVF
jgi:hypothetical protein